MESNNFEYMCNLHKSITLNKRQLCDFELIVNGGFSPLKGFMKKDDYKSCVQSMRLKDGSLWSMPITLFINEKQRDELMHSDYVVLKHETGLPLGIMDIRESNSIFKPDIIEECKKVYGSDDDNHPYVKIQMDYLDNGYEYYIGGDIIHFKLPPHYDFNKFRMTPEETKSFFRENGWNKVIGFQTRNPMHRSHYELTQYALRVAGEGARVLIHPVVGITQDCDVNYHTRVKCYKELMKYYEQDTAKLCLLPLSMRMAGPREAVWHAQIRKNYGCTHFVVGRDHAGPSYKKKNGDDFYGHYDAQELLIKHADEIGIIPIISKLIVYAISKTEENIMKGSYMAINDVDKEKYDIMKISGTKQREMLRKGEDIPLWFTFPAVVKVLKDAYKPLYEQGFTLYFVGLSGCGKSTIANFVISKLNELTNREITYLDGDIVRRNLSKGLGFSKEDRSTNVRRIGFLCSEVTKHNGIAVAANIAPYEDDRDYNRKSISSNGNYIEVFVNTSLEACEKRDVKGLYKLARQGIIKQFTGISDPFEDPINAEIVLNGTDTIEKSVDSVINYLIDKGLLKI
jgi:sulfate adenylyltransferase